MASRFEENEYLKFICGRSADWPLGYKEIDFLEIEEPRPFDSCKIGLCSVDIIRTAKAHLTIL
jgi:hypothetical protein